MFVVVRLRVILADVVRVAVVVDVIVVAPRAVLVVMTVPMPVLMVVIVVMVVIVAVYRTIGVPMLVSVRFAFDLRLAASAAACRAHDVSSDRLRRSRSP
jgi:hypothetical protein